MKKIMNAPTLNIRWSEDGRSETATVGFDDRFLSSRIGVRLREQRCPSCNSVVYTRRHNRCGVCEQELPENFLFNRAEAEKVDALLRAEQQRHKNWLSKYG